MKGREGERCKRDERERGRDRGKEGEEERDPLLLFLGFLSFWKFPDLIRDWWGTMLALSFSQPWFIVSRILPQF